MSPSHGVERTIGATTSMGERHAEIYPPFLRLLSSFIVGRIRSTDLDCLSNSATRSASGSPQYSTRSGSRGGEGTQGDTQQ
jgi:hypothetical protein